MKSHLYKTAAGCERLEQWHERFLAKIETPVETRTITTRLGESQVLVAGPADAPPLVVLHAMRTGAAFLLSELGPLLTKYRVYAPELPGQSVRGLDTRLPLKDDTAAIWLEEIFDGLSLFSVNLLGVSWGGFVARLAAAHMPDSVQRLALFVPAGIANGSHLAGLTKMAWPMIRYQVRPSDANLRKLLAPLMSTWDEDWGGFIACTIRDLKMDPRIPPVASDQQLQQLTMPVLAIVGEEDISFPGHLVERRLKSQLPSAEVEVVPGMKHCPPTTPEFRAWLAQRLKAFFG